MNVAIGLFAVFVSTAVGVGAKEPEGKGHAMNSVEQRLGNALVSAHGDRLTISTGVVERVWEWTGHGLLTVSLRHLPSGRQWATAKSGRQCDWTLPGAADQEPAACLVDIAVRRGTDQGFTSEHIETVVTLDYPEVGLRVQYVIRAYADAPGLWTQLRARSMPGTESAPPPRTAARQRHRVDVAIPPGHALLRLVVTDAGDGKTCDHADWANAGFVLGGRQGKGQHAAPDVFVSDLDPVRATVGWGAGAQRDRSIEGRPIRVGGVPYAKGMGVHAPSELAYALEPRYRRFVANVGLDDEKRGGSVEFEVYADADLLFATRPANAPCVDYVPAVTPVRRWIGYYNDTQHRNRHETPILREEVSRRDIAAGTDRCDWASIGCLEDGVEGLALVKESPKCVNQSGYDTGAFTYGPDGLRSTGWGIRPADILEDRFLTAWASWCILWHGGVDARELAIKRFDRSRYPVDPDRDMYIMANTWGSSDNGNDAKRAAREENVLREIDSQADLGIDVQQIDDGWQGNEYKHWHPAPDRYPAGWVNVVRHAREKGVVLGLWAAGERIPLKDLVWNWEHGRFRYYKLDFLNLADRPRLERMMAKARAFVLHTNHRVRVNWDVTENAPRVGYFFAREFGNIYLENRKPRGPAHVVYIPHLVLRDAWHVAHYLNLNKFQVTVQNIDRVDQNLSNAWQYNHPYCVAITLMGSPIFFQETHYYNEAARKQIRDLLAVYKKHRRQMFRGYVFPVGAEPDDAEWTGFQNHNPATGIGYLLIFRELNNGMSERELVLHFVGGSELCLQDLRHGGERTVAVPADGRVRFAIERPADFLFYRYTLATGK